MEAVGLTVVYATAGLAVSCIVGAACDYVFPHALKESGTPPRFATNSAAVMAALEAGAQVVVNCLLGAAMVAAIVAVPEAVADPASGLAFAMGLQWSQPHLAWKIQRLVAHVVYLWDAFYTPDASSSKDTPASRSGGAKDERAGNTALGVPVRTGTRDAAGQRFEALGLAGTPVDGEL